MKLYYSSGACSLASHIVLEEAGAKFDVQKISLREGEQRKPDYQRINWKSKVPALELDDGQVLTENPVIQQYVADHHAAAKLLAPSGIERYRALEWLAWCASGVQPTFGPVFHQARFVDGEAAQASVKEHGLEAVQAVLDQFDARLQGKKFALGEQFSVADSYSIVFYRWAKGYSLKPGDTHRDQVKRLLERAGVQRALHREGITVEA